jgi:hypothetical protein
MPGIETGRGWEAIAAGCALIEQENASTEALFVPYLRYLLYRDVDEIVQLHALPGMPRRRLYRPDLARPRVAARSLWSP